MTQAKSFDNSQTLQDIFRKLDTARSGRAETDQERAAREFADAEETRKNWLDGFIRTRSEHDLPKGFESASIKNLDATGSDASSFEILKAWRHGDGFGFFLVGPAGCGKSYALMAMAMQVMTGDPIFSRRQQSLRWFSVSAGLDRVRREMAEDSDKYKRAIMRADYLFIDDLGAENMTDWAREVIYQILEYRIANGGVTFISSNCSFEEIKTRYHERFLSRIKEICVVLQLTGTDRRNDKMKANLQALKARVKAAL